MNRVSGKKTSFMNFRHMLMTSVMLLALPLPAMAQADTAIAAKSDVHDFEVHGGSLEQGLREVAATSGQRVKFDAEQLRNYKTKAFKGSFATVEIIQAMISESGLTMTIAKDGSILVFEPNVVVTARRSEAETGFTKSRADSSTRLDIDLHELPQSVQVITSQAIESQQATSLIDVLQNASGVVTREGAQGSPSFSVRGFVQTSSMMNGSADENAVYTNVAGVDSIEILKGPQAILSGGDSLGGGVNIVTKKPTTEKIRDVTLQYGSNEDKSISADFSGPFADKRFSYRIIGSTARAEDSDAGFDGREADYIKGALRYKDDKADFIISISHDKQFIPANRYTFALTGDMQPIPSMRLGASDNGVNVKNDVISYEFKYDFNSWVSFISNLSQSSSTTDLNLYTPIFPLDSENIAYQNTNSIAKTKTLSGDHYFRFDFNTGPIEQKLSIGINHSKTNSDTTSYSGDLYYVPIYEEQFDFPVLERNSTTLYSQLYNAKSKQVAVFAQSYMTWNKLHLSLNVRRTNTKSPENTLYYPAWDWSSVTPAFKSNKTTGGAGVVYDINSQWAVYGSYSQGYLPQFLTTKRCDAPDSYDYPPMETENSEIGAKFKSRDGKYTITASAFELDQKNVLEYNSSGCYDIRKAQKIKGFELDGSGEFIKDLKLLFNYTYSDAEDQGDVDEDSKLPALAPKHQASIWASYKFPQATLKGFGVEGGVTAASSSKFGTGGEFKLPSYQKVDLSVYYQTKSLKVTLGVKNLFDETIYGATSSELYVPVLAGRTAALTVKKSF